MTQLSYSLPVTGQPNSSEDPKVHDALQQILTVVNGGLDPDNFDTGIMLELASTGTARKIAFGTTTFTWPGASRFSQELTITHGLGTTPILAWGFPIVSNVWMDIQTYTYAGGTFKMAAFETTGAAPGPAVSSTLGWVAIG